MAITTFTELQTAVNNWLNRADIGARIPEFITLAEADLRRNLRNKSVTAALTLDAGVDTKALPATVAELRSLRFDTATFQNALRATTPAALADLRRISSGVPLYYAVINGTILLDCAPDISYPCEIVYFEKLVPLQTTPTNTTLVDSPDLYLYATLKEAEPFLEHDDRNPMWAQKYRQALEDENNQRERAELGAAPISIGLPVVFE